MGLSCYMQSFSSCGEQGLQFVVCTGFSLQWLLLWNTGSRHMGFSSCGMWALLRVWHTGLVALWHVESSPTRDQNGVPCIARQFWTTETPGKTGNIWFWCHRAPDIVWRKCECTRVCACMHMCVYVCVCLTYALSCSCCSVTKWCPTLWDPTECSIPGFPVLHYLLESSQTQTYWVDDSIQPSHPLSPPFPTALKLSQHQHLF